MGVNVKMIKIHHAKVFFIGVDYIYVNFKTHDYEKKVFFSLCIGFFSLELFVS